MEKDNKNNNIKKTSDEKKALLTEDVALGEVSSDKIFENDPELAKELAEDRKIQEKAREYKNLLEERKRQKRKVILITLAGTAAVILVILLSVRYYKQKYNEANSEAEITITEDQELVYGEITSIAGNNITIRVQQGNAAEGNDDAAGNDAEENFGADGSQRKGAGRKEAQGDESQAQGEGSQAQGDESQTQGEGSQAQGDESQTQDEGSQGEKPEGGPGAGQRKPKGAAEENTGENSDFAQDNMENSESEQGNAENSESAETEDTAGETMELQIPVGTTVITRLGTTTTFTSLSKDDVVAIALEAGTQTIDKIWIVG